jgi:DNA-binding SARP family transcriptional activator
MPSSDGSADELQARLWLALAQLRLGQQGEAEASLAHLLEKGPPALGPGDCKRFAELLPLLGLNVTTLPMALAPSLAHALRSSREETKKPARSVEIRLLGAPQLLVDGNPVEFREWTYRRALELFCYLVTRRKAVRRDELIAAIMPDVPEERARQALSTALARMRRALRIATGYVGDPVRLDDRDRCSLDLEGLAESVTVDIEELTALAKEVRLESWAGQVAQLLRLTGGEFLEGFDNEWVLPFRRWHAEFADTTLSRTLAYCEAAGRLQDALALAERMVALDPDDVKKAERARTLRQLVGDSTRATSANARVS